jgi:uncharacterized protein (TIGR00299 family) protein
MPIAILDPFSGISGDMTLGALVDVGLDPAWLTALPRVLGLDGVTVRVQEVLRGEIACKKVEFDIPPQPHGRHIREIRRMVAAAGVPPAVEERANACFTAIAVAEGAIHGMDPERVHLHEVGAVDAILDVVGAVWGLSELGIDEVYCGILTVGDGFVKAAHGMLPVPAPATLKLLEGHTVRPGPEGAGELVTPTGAALVKVLSRGAPPAPIRPARERLRRRHQGPSRPGERPAHRAPPSPRPTRRTPPRPSATAARRSWPWRPTSTTRRASTSPRPPSCCARPARSTWCSSRRR